jgi:hypothetical protein
MIRKSMRSVLVAPAALLGGLLAFAGQAGAVAYTATYTGQVGELVGYGTYTDVLDGSDVIPGAAFTAVIKWDDGDADPSSSVDLPLAYSLYNGPITATLTIGTSSFTFEALAGNVLYIDGTASSLIHDVDSGFTHGADYREALSLYTNGGDDLLASWDWRIPGTYDLTGASSFGGFIFQDLDGLGHSLNGRGAYLTPTSLVVARQGDVSAAPEPTAWALMIVGFGGAGAMLRRRERAAV